MVRTRSGRGLLGCLLPLLLLAVAVYFGVNVGEAYWRFARFRDAMEQEARFAQQRDDETIRQHLRSVADSLGLPESAQRVQVRRTDKSIAIFANYAEQVELPLHVREFRFAPRVERRF
jgi:hypothetical protein